MTAAGPFAWADAGHINVASCRIYAPDNDDTDADAAEINAAVLLRERAAAARALREAADTVPPEVTPGSVAHCWQRWLRARADAVERGE